MKPRENIIRYSGIRTVLTEDPVVKLDELFQHYVERQFANRVDYQEKIMQKRMARLLHQHQLDQVYRERTFRDPVTDYQVKLPFVREENGQATQAIKPLHLAHDRSTQILEHGDAWCAKLERLNRLPEHPDRILFVLNVPEDKKRKRAADEIREKIREAGAEPILERDKEALLRYA